MSDISVLRFKSICVTVVVGLAVDYVVHIGISYTEHYHALYSKNTNNEGMPHHHTATVNAMTDLGISGKHCISMWKMGLFFVFYCMWKMLWSSCRRELEHLSRLHWR